MSMVDVHGKHDDIEDGEINNGFIGQMEMENRKTLAAAYGTDVSWVEAVILGAKHVEKAGSADDNDGDGGDDDNTHSSTGEPPPPGTAADRPPPSGAATARLEAALVHKITALLGGGDGDNGNDGRQDAAETLVGTLAEAATDGVDVGRWLGHGRSSIRGRTPLMEAARRDKTGCCAVLAEAACAQGSGLNAGNETEGRNSALHYACYEGAGGSVCELLVRGADPRLRNRDGETALQAALANWQTECADLVRDFLRRPTFEPDPQSRNSFFDTIPIPHGPGGGETGGNSEVGGRSNVQIAGVAGVAPEVSRANAVFCLGRRRRRLGAGVRRGRGLGVGVGTAAAEVVLGARRGARLHATNPCSGTAMEAFVLLSIASGQDPFHSEAGGGGGGGGIGGEPGDEFGEVGGQHCPHGRGAADVWLEHYVRIYDASLNRWYNQQQQQRDGRGGQVAARRREEEEYRRIRGPSHVGDVVGGGSAAAAVASAVARSGGGGGGVGGGTEFKGSTYALVVMEGKALAEGTRFELRCGADLVIGRSQSQAGIVVKDDMVSKSHLRIVNSELAGVRLTDLGSKHGAIIAKPAPTSTTHGNAAATAPTAISSVEEGRGGGGGGERVAAPRPAGLGGPPPPLPKNKIFPIPVPREPEWVAGMHGDRISLGKTVLLLEREGGPEPPAAQQRQAATPGGGAGAAADGSRAGGSRTDAARGKQAPAVISKGFAANPNLMDAIRAAEDMEKERKRTAAASELAAAAAAQYLSNKRARSTAVAPAVPATRSPPSAAAVTSGSTATGGAGAEEGLQGGLSFDHVSKGSMLLRRMGWKEGQGLGRRSDGHLQPVQIQRRGERAGLGTQSNSSPFAVGADGRVSKWEQMRRRFSEAQSSGAGFGEVRRRSNGAGGGRWLRGEAEGGDDES